MAQYNRHAIAPIDVIIPEIKKYWDSSIAKMEFGGWIFNIYSMRLRTFCRAAYEDVFHCSSCKLPAQYFAVESFRSDKKEIPSVHVNLYGMKDDEEMLFTHDHTLARSLGGADDLSNTTMMCFKCNNLKAQTEMKLKEELRQKVKNVND